MMPLSADPVSRLTKEQAIDLLPDVIVGLLQHHLIATVKDRGPGPKNRVAVITGSGLNLKLHIDDWNLLSDNILYDPETVSTLGIPDPSAPPPPDHPPLPWRPGSLLTVKGPSPGNRRYNPRTPINRQLLLRRDGSFKAYIVERLSEIFV